MFSYTVKAWFDDPAVADEWIQWLRSEHISDVIDAGALDGTAILMDGDDHRSHCQVRYHFESRDSFEQYLREHAASLREQGLKLFPESRGISYQRETGDVRCSFDRSSS